MELIIRWLPDDQLAVACSFDSIERALRALDLARQQIAAGRVPMQGQRGIEIVPTMPANLKAPKRL